MLEEQLKREEQAVRDSSASRWRDGNPSRNYQDQVHAAAAPLITLAGYRLASLLSSWLPESQ